MDIVTQGILGATVAQSAAKKQHVRLAAFIGFVAGVIADADVLIRSSSDPCYRWNTIVILPIQYFLYRSVH